MKNEEYIHLIKRKDKTDLLLISYCVYIVLLSASCSDFFSSLKAQIVFIVFSVLILFKNNFRWPNDRTGIFLFISFGMIVFVHYLSSGVFMFGSIKFFSMLLCLYYVLRTYNLLFLKKLIDVIFSMTLITVPFYILQLININTLRSLVSLFNYSIQTQANAGGVYIFVFNISPDGWGDWYRNSGFMWEPGAFGGILIFAIVFYYLYYNYMLNWRIIFLFFYCMTTVSTAAIFALLLFLALVVVTVFQKKSYMLVLGFVIILLVSIKVYTLPFMGEKMEFYAESNMDFRYAYKSTDFSSGTSIGRFSGFLIEFEKFKKNPIFGHGWDSNYREIGIGNEWTNPSGLAVLMGKFGIVGIAFILIGLYYYSLFRGTGYIYRNIIVFIMILVPLFSNPFQINLVFWSLVMMGIVNSKRKLFLRIHSSPNLN